MNLRIFLDTEAASQNFAVDLACILQKGDFIALKGDLGAGKTTLARAIIRQLAGEATLEVPSPTFSLVQHYELDNFSVTHADLYRLDAMQDVEELGLIEAREQGILLVEWPQRAAQFLPTPTFSLSLEFADNDIEEGRWLEIETIQSAQKRLTRSLEIRAFLNDHDFKGGQRQYLAGDASSRRYETIILPDDKNKKWVLMDGALMHPVPPSQPATLSSLPAQDYAKNVHLAQNVSQFVGIARLLSGQNFSAPHILAADFARGLVLLEHLGQDGLVDDKGGAIPMRYLAAAALLGDIHSLEWPRTASWPDLEITIAAYDESTLYREAVLLLDWYFPFCHQGQRPHEEIYVHYKEIWAAIFTHLAQAEQGLCLRDYHSPNIIWREDKMEKSQLGLIDFQDALIGPVAYDVASLAQDARITIESSLETAIIDSYCARRKAHNCNFDEYGLREVYALVGAQRAAKILGLFVRLNERDGKAEYLAHLPRLIDYFQKNLAHPHLHQLRCFCQHHHLI